MNDVLDAPKARDFWKSSGFHLVARDGDGWLTVTPELLRAYYARPEIHPVEESCAAEIALFERLMEDPALPVTEADLAAIADADTAGNYRVLLRFRDHLLAAGSIEAAYAGLFRKGAITIPPVFLDQMVHLILRNILDGERDPIVLRAAEIFFRPQIATLGEDQVMLADQEIVEMTAERGVAAPGQFKLPGVGPREAQIDVLTTETAQEYWARSDQFDTAVDFRFTQPASDGLAHVMSRWIAHFLKVETRIQAMASIKDAAWSWHVGCDADSTRILNALYAGQELSEDELYRIIALYRLEFEDAGVAIESMSGKPVYLGCAIDANGVFSFKPQNLLTNLPLRTG
ncbi:MAG: DUF6352 family protein [Pseudomonadota bacterium]